MNTVVRINGTDYAAHDRAVARIALNEWTGDLGGFGAFTFHEFGALPASTFTRGAAVTVKTDGTLRFSGRITQKQSQQDGFGWTHGYTAQPLRWLAERFVPVTAPDGTGTYSLDTPPDDEFASPSDRGLPLGTVFTRLLLIAETAQRLDALGVGGYTGLPSSPALPASTVADLALLTTVPPVPAIFQGKAIFGQMESLVARYMPRFTLRVGPDGIIRFLDTTDIGIGKTFVPKTFTLPSMYGSGDPISSFPQIRESVEECATNVKIRGGPHVEGQILSEVDGTLAKGFTSPQISAWTLTSFTSPGGATDYGTITACTSTSATVQSHDATVSWASNFWNNNQGTIFLSISNVTDTTVGVIPYTARQVTACDALTAAGTAVVHWDASSPLSESDYNRYRIVGSTGGLQDVWRLYYPKDRNSGATGLSTFIGQHMVRKSPIPIKWANTTTTLGEYYTQGVVVGPSKQSLPVSVEPVPSLGGYRFTQPTVTVFGNKGTLQRGSPTTVGQGLPADVQIFALFSVGALSAVYPADTMGAPTYSGTASADWQFTEYVDVPSWTWTNNQPDMNQLAHEYWRSMSDVVYDMDLSWNVDSTGTLPAWDSLDFSWAMNIAVSGSTSPWSAVNAPVRAVKITWQGEAMPQVLSFAASSRRRPFTGDDLYTHPQFASGSALSQATEGAQGGMFGSGGMFQMRDMVADSFSQASNFNNRYVQSSEDSARSAMSDSLNFAKSLGTTSGGDGDQFSASNSHRDARNEREAEGPDARSTRAMYEAATGTTETDVARNNREQVEGIQRQQIAQNNDAGATKSMFQEATGTREADVARNNREQVESIQRQQITQRNDDRSGATATREMLAEAGRDPLDNTVTDTTAGGG